MTPKERAAMRQALEALERWRDWDDCNNTAAFGLDDEDAITALREALAEQAEQEPVGNRIVGNNFDGYIIENLYAAPVRTKDLTDADVAKIKGFYAQASFETIVRAAIAADREKNNV